MVLVKMIVQPKTYLVANKIAYMHRSSLIYRVNEGSMTQTADQATIFQLYLLQNAWKFWGFLVLICPKKLRLLSGGLS